MMDIFENTRLRSKDYWEVENGLYGKEAWDQYLLNNSFYFISFNQELDGMIELFQSIKYKNKNHYESFYRKKGISFDEYVNCSDEIITTLKKYDTTLIRISDNRLFRAKLLNQLVFLSKEIYQKGYFNYPTLYFDGDIDNIFITVHPGQHLYWVKQFLGLDTISFISVNNRYQPVFQRLVDKELITIIKQVKNSDDIVSIFTPNSINPDRINAFINLEGNQHVPSINCSIPDDKEWDTFEENGLNKWPWENVHKFHEFYLNQPWINIFKHSADWRDYIELKRKYSNNKLLFNNMFSFLLLNIKEDSNFLNKQFKE